jgi:hypothetical protein
MTSTATQTFGFICCYSRDNDKHEVYAPTRYEAQQKALAHFQAKYPRRKIKSHEVSADLAECNGEPVIHSTASIG